MTLQLGDENFEETISGDQPVLVDFYTPTWPPCKQLGPVVDELAANNQGKSIVAKVNVNDHMELAVKYGITGVPTILVFKNGEVVARDVGFKPLDKLQGMLDAHTSA